MQSIDISRGSRNDRLLTRPKRPLRDDRARSKSILQRLEAIDPRTSVCFKLKEQAQDKFRMRLLKVGDADVKTDSDGLENTGGSSKDKASDDASHEYIALSYCWHYEDWTPSHDLGRRVSSPDSRALLPITTPMWKAFLAERDSPSEAIWVDQGCIQQANLADKTYAINSMDVVFGAARKVVIALEDVTLSPDDAEALMKYCHSLQSISGRERSLIWADWLQFVDGKEELALACLKIFRARWFRRAWCLHEFLTAKSHTFLVPVMSGTLRSKNLNEHVQILSFDGEFLLAVLLARTDWIVSQNRNELASTIRHHENILSNAKLGSKVAIDRFLIQNSIMVGFTQGLVEATLKRRSAESMKPFLAALGDILSLDSSSAVDKLVITLNVLKTGLSYQGPLDMNDTDVSMMITMVALAAGDASALASSGPFLDVGRRYPFTDPNINSSLEESQLTYPKISDKNRIGWATKPQVDTYSRLGLERIESPVTALMTPRGLQLDMMFVANSSAIRPPNDRFMESASKLLSLYPKYDDHVNFDFSSTDEDAVLAEFRAFSLERDQVQQVLTGIDRPQFVQALACLLELGCWWVVGYGRKLRPNYLDDDSGERNGQMEKVQQAVSWALSLPSYPTLIKSQKKSHDASNDSETHLKHLIQYASQIVRTGAGERSEFVKGQLNTDYAFQICEIQDIASDVPFDAETIVYAPLNTSSPYELAIPAPLAASGFPVDMNRVWILEKKKPDSESGVVPHEVAGATHEHHMLRGKTRFVGCTVPYGDLRTVIVSG